MFLPKIAVNRPVLTTTIILIFIFFGALAYLTLNLNIEPEVEIPYITISTVYPGAGPKEIENLVTKKIEDEVSTISGIERIESYSLEGVSIIIIEFKLGKNVDVANREVKDQVDKILNKLPLDAQKPIIQKVDLQAFPIIELVVSGNRSPIELYELADKNIRERLSQIPGVASVEITGGQEREIRVQFDNRIVFENSISLPQIQQILKANNLDIPGGSFQFGKEEYSVRVKGEYNSLQSLRDLRIPTPYGPKKLNQIAIITDTGKDISARATFFDNQTKTKNENVVRVSIVKSADANAVKVSEAVTEILPEIQSSLNDVTIRKVEDAADFTRNSFNDTMSNIYLGIIFTGIVLFLFLFNWRSTVIVGITMPVSIVSTFLLFRAAGMTLNMLSLMGISVSIGVLVANSVVVLENIFRYRMQGYTSKDSAFLGTKEVVVAVLAATLTNIIVFLPIANISSIVGQFLKDLALAATFATLFSLFYSFTLTPMVSSLLLPNDSKESKLDLLAHKVEQILKDWYLRALKVVLKNKVNTMIAIIATLIIFILSVVLITPKLGYEFIPSMDNSEISIDVELPQGFNLDATANKIREIENKIIKHKEIETIITNIGKKDNLNTGSNLARIDLKLCEPDKRDISIQGMIALLIQDLADVPNVKLNVKQPQSMRGGGEAPIQFYLCGQDIDTLEKYKNLVIDKIKETPGLINFDNSSRSGKQEITVYPRRELLAETGLTIADIAYTIRASIEGIKSTSYRDKGNEFDITITLDDRDVDTPDKIGNITVVSSNGSYRLSQLADIQTTPGVSRILHRDKSKVIMFFGSNAPGYPLGNVTQEIEKRMKEIQLPQGYLFKWAGDVKMMNEMVMDMLLAFAIATFLTYMLLSAILESFVQPIYIMITLPLGLIGVLLFMYLTRTTFNLTSLMGIVMLIGLVVNNAILILDYVNQLIRQQNFTVKDALLEAAPTKLKPQIMSTAALILGMLPMALQIGESGKEIRAPLGIVSIGGLLVSTILTLFIVPSFLYVFSRGKRK